MGINQETDNIFYIYSAAGEKLAKKMKDNSYQYYAGNMVYKNDRSLNYLLMDEGMVNKVSGGYAYEYHLKDHLGNTRVAFQPNGSATTVTQATEYYPFGMNYMPHSPAGTNKYLYNGKEKQDDNLSGTFLDWYDYGARFYDAALGRWSVIDNKAEEYYSTTPYAYCLNNPIIFIDPDGNEVRLSFASSSAQSAYTNLVNSSLGGAYKVSYTTVKDGKGYTNQSSLTAVKGFSGTVTDSQKAFAKEYGNAVNSSDVAKMKVVENDAKTVVGSWVTGKLDMTDVAEFDKAGTGAASSAGALIHETTEQLEKSKMGLSPGDLGKVAADGSYTDYEKGHKEATKSENKVNGNTRNEAQGYFKEKDGSKTQQTVTASPSGGVTITKKKIK